MSQNFARITINKEIIHQEMWHKFDASKVERKLTIFFLFKEDHPNHDITTGLTYEIGIIDISGSQTIDLGLMELKSKQTIIDGSLVFAQYNFIHTETP